MAAPINTNRYRLILLLYLVFICLSLLSVPASLLESNLYVIRTLSYQEQIIKKQLSRSDQLVNEVDSLTLTKQPSIKVFIGLQQEIRRSFLFLDSIENALLDTLRSQGTSVEREYAKRRKLNSFFAKDSLAFTIEKNLFSLASRISQYDTALGSEFSRWLPATTWITTQNGKKIRWVNFFFLNKSASVSYMQFKRIKLLLLQYQSDNWDKVNSLVAQALLVNQDRLNLMLKEQQRQNSTTSATLDELATSNQQQLREKQLQFDLLKGIRLDRFYAGVSLPLLTAIPNLNMEGIDVEFTPQVRVSKTVDQISVLFPASGQYQLKLYLRNRTTPQFLLERTVYVQKLPDPEVQLLSDNTSRNVISSAELIRASRLKTAFTASGLPAISSRVNGFRVTVLNAGKQSAAIYNYGQIFQEETKQLFSTLKRGDIILFDNITVAVGDETTRSIRPFIYKISD